MLDYFCFLYLINDKQNNITDETFNYNITDQKRNMLSKTKQKHTHEICHCKGLKLYGKRQSSSLSQQTMLVL